MKVVPQVIWCLHPVIRLILVFIWSLAPQILTETGLFLRSLWIVSSNFARPFIIRNVVILRLNIVVLGFYRGLVVDTLG